MVKKVTPAADVDESPIPPKKKTAVKKAEVAAPVAKATKKVAAEPEVKAKSKKVDRTLGEGDINQMKLATLCEENDIDPRTARIKLRKSEYNVGAGNRWQWELGSKQLAAVTKFLTAEPAAEK